MLQDVPDRVLVVGGASGIGRAISVALRDAGFLVDIIYHSSDSAEANSVVGKSGMSWCVDLSTIEGLAEADRYLRERETVYYGLVHAAGRSYDKLASATELHNIEHTTRLNYTSFVTLVSCLLPGMLRSKRGRILAVGSVAAHKASAGNAVYSGSKAALEGFVRCLAVEAARRGVTANVVAPGYVSTPMLEGYSDARRSSFLNSVPARRFADRSEIASLVCYLLSAPASYINGATIPIDGGLSAS